MKIFSYGSIILPTVTKNFFSTIFPPEKSVFLLGYKVILKESPDEQAKYFKNTKKYYNIICTKTNKVKDIVPGFIVEIPDNLIEKVDEWEGSNYKREKIYCYDRFLNKYECYIYSKR